MNTLLPEGSITDVKIPAALASQGIAITRRLVRYAYAKNGNWHDPTPEYDYLVYFNGKAVSGRERLLRDAKEFAVEYLATPPSKR